MNKVDELLQYNRSDLFHPLFDILMDLLANKKSGKHVLVLPRRLELPALVCLWHALLKNINMGKGTELKKLSFRKGRKLSVNNVVCKFESLDAGKEEIKLLMKYRNGTAFHTVPFHRIFRLYPVAQNTPLTVATSLINKSHDGDSVIFGTLNSLHSVVVTGLNKFKNAFGYIKKLNLVNCAKLDNEGRIVPLEANAVGQAPNCLVTSNIHQLFKFIQFCEDFSGPILIDGSSHVLESRTQFERFILKREIPVTVFTDHREKKEIRELQHEGFKIIEEKEWTDRVRFPKTTVYHHINHLFEVSKNICLNQVHFRNDRLSECHRILKKNQYNAFEKINEYFNEANMELLRLSRSVVTEEYFRDPKIDRLKKFFSGNQQVKRLITLLELLDEEKKERINRNEKAEYIMQFVENHLGQKILLVVQNKHEKEVWEEAAGCNEWLNFRVETPDNFGRFYEPFDKMLISGYLGKKKLDLIISAYTCREIYMLLWEHELYYYKFYYEKFIQKMKQSNQRETTGSQEDSSGMDQKSLQINHDDFDKDLLKGYETKNEKLARTVIPVEFEGGYHAFFTPTYPLYKILGEEGDFTTGKVKEMKPEQLAKGDRIIYIKSRSDRIRKYVDEEILQNDLYIRETAKLWQTALRVKFKEKRNNFEQLFKILKSHGLKRNKVTVNNWLKKDMIGPADINDIDIIAEATGYEPLKKRVEEVKNAVSLLRSAHHEASHSLVNEVLQQIQRNYEEISATLETESDKMYQCLVVKGVGKKTDNIKKSYVNKIFFSKEGVSEWPE
ncbi:hypothetical protein H1R82_10945 [Thermoactinomyces intermedius]|uniref:DISARM protein DrmE C-terminal domain-containing protein n=1 Tax=Thermoactinomyces intermedius TaxID=2024 RepID=A0A8I1DE80_THEIN|nr:DrmE family protein [Thermoactinomyces intermedius]MBA4548794.1 hypothetical protein [Thermoactinomyces intermedius]MBA4837144.1 hypothetical protein [Thermoactinomyces intermedius]MBH8594672.1 hypothetical protein [Thermoactinomyces intermedius]